MSHKPTAYLSNLPQSQGYEPPPDQSFKMMPYPESGGQSSGYPGPPPGSPPSTVAQVPQPGFQPGYPYPEPACASPIIQQPAPQASGGWMTSPQDVGDICPPGLEYLTMIDQLIVHQKVELLEVVIGFETNNKYSVKNSAGQKVYFAVEDNDCCTRNCCGPLRPFDMKIMDNFGREVIHLNRPLACQSWCCPCWLQTMEVTSPPGTLIGSIEQEWTICKPCFRIKNAQGDVVLRIKGPICTCSCGGDVEFNVYSVDGERIIGKISKQWTGLLRELFTDADNFGISFPMDLDVKMKAVLLGACFLIDFMFYENSDNNGLA